MRLRQQTLLLVSVCLCFWMSTCLSIPDNGPYGNKKDRKNGSLLQMELNAAIQNPMMSTFHIPSGEYYFEGMDFEINDAHDMTIYSEDEAIMYFDCLYAMYATNCSNSSFLNISMDYDPPCFAQGTVAGYNATAKTVLIDVEQGYPLPDPSINPFFDASVVKVIYWDRSTDRLQKGQTGANNWNYSSHIIGRLYQIKLLGFPVTPEIGDYATIGPRTANGFTCENCGNMSITDLTIYQSTNMAVFERFGYGNNTYTRYRLIRREGSDRLLTSTADGFHSHNNQHGPTLQHSMLSFAGDDFVNVHNRINLVLHRVSPMELHVIDTNYGSTFNSCYHHVIPGQTEIKFYELNTLAYLGKGTVESIRESQNPMLIKEAHESFEKIQEPPYNAKLVVNYTESAKVFVIRFHRPLPSNVTQYQLVEVDLNSGALIRGNYFQSSFDSLVKLKSKHSYVHDNVFANAFGLHIATEQQWLEGAIGLCDITVADNIFKGCGPNPITQGPATSNITLYNNIIEPTIARIVSNREK